jgi:DNA-binding transcriptional LysR family regulator
VYSIGGFILIMRGMHMDNLSLSSIRLMDALARSGNLSAAAEEIGLSQSAASHALSRLRKELSDPLFVRTSDGMQPTPYGMRLASSVREALLALQRGLSKGLEFDPSRSARTFNVIMSDVGEFLTLPGLISRLSKEAPEVVFRSRPMPLKAPHLLLESGEVDLAKGAWTSLIVGCRQRRLYREQYVCVARRDHPNFQKGMTADAFCKSAHVVVDPKGHVHEHLDAFLSKERVPRIPKLCVGNFLSLPVVIAQSDLVVIMGSRLAKKLEQLVPLTIMPPPVKLPSYTVSLFWHERFDRDPANLWLRSVYTDLFGEKR